jgi:hypothetical protein
MSTFKDHCNACYVEFGNPFPHVHKYLDELFSKLGPKHRAARHHKDGVDEVRKRWGDDAALAAESHIKLDWDWHPEFRGEVPTRRQAELWTMEMF